MEEEQIYEVTRKNKMLPQERNLSNIKFQEDPNY